MSQRESHGQRFQDDPREERISFYGLDPCDVLRMMLATPAPGWEPPEKSEEADDGPR